MFVLTFGPAVAFPGANAAFTVATALEQPRLRALLVPLGFAVATALHALLALTGASVILTASITLFQMLKWAAVLYLVWTGWRHWRRSGQPSLPLRDGAASKHGLVIRAAAVSLSNPQAILASALIFPLFITVDAPLLPQAAVLVATAAAISLVVYSVYALTAAAVRPWLLQPAARRRLDQTIGSFYLLAAAGLAMTRARS